MFMKESIIKAVRENPGIRWTPFISIEDKPIKYLEIGVFKGDNIVDMSKSYCKHPESIMHCVDPWIDYAEYPEYKGKIQKIYDVFVENMTKEQLWDKVVVHRNFSHNVVPTFENDFFDIAFIDGNHETEFVYKDGVMTFPKVKPGGVIIFDDYNWPQTRVGINKFVTEYSSKLTNIKHTPFQLMVEKL